MSVEQALWFIVGVLALIVGLGISIGLHEWGHFAPAKRFGVGITKFMVGFGPTVWSTQRGETEFGVKAIPLGGFVAMHGMFAPSESTRRRGGAGTDFAGMEPLLTRRRLTIHGRSIAECVAPDRGDARWSIHESRDRHGALRRVVDGLWHCPTKPHCGLGIRVCVAGNRNEDAV